MGGGVEGALGGIIVGRILVGGFWFGFVVYILVFLKELDIYDEAYTYHTYRTNNLTYHLTAHLINYIYISRKASAIGVK